MPLPDRGVPAVPLPDEYNQETREGRWQYKKILGEGAFGIVHEAIDVQTGEHVAVKVLRTQKVLDCLLASREVRCARFFKDHIFPKTGHRIFVNYLEDHTGLADYPDEALFVWAEHGTWKGHRVESLLRKDAYIVMERVEGVSVRDMIKEDNLTLADCGSILHQAAYAIKGLHDRNCIHRDFRVHNLMWHSGKLKVLDFGLVMMDCVASSKLWNNPLVRTFWQADSYWMPPEIKRHSHGGRACNFYPGASYSFDIYSFGVLMVELLLDPVPHKRMTRNKHAIEEQGKTRLDPLKAIELIDTQHLRIAGFKPDFLARCLTHRGQDRPTPETVLQIKEKCYLVKHPLNLNSKPFAVFRSELNKIAGVNRADTSIHLISEMSRKIVDNSDYVTAYLEILFKFTSVPGVSVYRVLCIIDCVCRFADKTKDPENASKISRMFAPMMKDFVKAAYDKYDTSDYERKLDGVNVELGKVEHFVANWIRAKRFTEEELTARVRAAPDLDGIESPFSKRRKDASRERIRKQVLRLKRAREILVEKQELVDVGLAKKAKIDTESEGDSQPIIPSGDTSHSSNNVDGGQKAQEGCIQLDEEKARRLAKVQQLMAVRLETQANLRDKGSNGTDNTPLNKRHFRTAEQDAESIMPDGNVPSRRGSNAESIMPDGKVPSRRGSNAGSIISDGNVPSRRGSRAGSIMSDGNVPSRRGSNAGSIMPDGNVPSRRGSNDGSIIPDGNVPSRRGSNDGSIMPDENVPSRRGSNAESIMPDGNEPSRRRSNARSIMPDGSVPSRRGSNAGSIISDENVPSRCGSNAGFMMSDENIPSHCRSNAGFTMSDGNVPSLLASNAGFIMPDGNVPSRRGSNAGSIMPDGNEPSRRGKNAGSIMSDDKLKNGPLPVVKEKGPVHDSTRRRASILSSDEGKKRRSTSSSSNSPSPSRDRRSPKHMRLKLSRSSPLRDRKSDDRRRHSYNRRDSRQRTRDNHMYRRRSRSRSNRQRKNTRRRSRSRSRVHRSRSRSRYRTRVRTNDARSRNRSKSDSAERTRRFVFERNEKKRAEEAKQQNNEQNMPSRILGKPPRGFARKGGGKGIGKGTGKGNGKGLPVCASPETATVAPKSNMPSRWQATASDLSSEGSIQRRLARKKKEDIDSDSDSDSDSEDSSDSSDA